MITRPVRWPAPATKRSAFEPIRSRPQSIAEATAARPARNGAVPLRTSAQPTSTSPTIVKRTPAAKTGGIVSPASSIPRYVEPQRM
jgi:hypothetical protein